MKPHKSTYQLKKKERSQL